MVIIETSIFTRQVQQFLSDDDYRHLQLELIRRPEQGKIIPGSGGLRKIRWAPTGRGKSGALRTIYFWAVSDEIIFLLYIYTKNELENLSGDQLKLLRKIIKEEFK